MTEAKRLKYAPPVVTGSKSSTILVLTTLEVCLMQYQRVCLRELLPIATFVSTFLIYTGSCRNIKRLKEPSLSNPVRKQESNAGQASLTRLCASRQEVAWH